MRLERAGAAVRREGYAEQQQADSATPPELDQVLRRAAMEPRDERQKYVSSKLKKKSSAN